jgi:hypothetical protein
MFRVWFFWYEEDHDLNGIWMIFGARFLTGNKSGKEAKEGGAASYGDADLDGDVKVKDKRGELLGTGASDRQ